MFAKQLALQLPQSQTQFVPHKYQKLAIKWLISRGAAGLFLDPGLGKTICILWAFKLLKEMIGYKTMLVIAPLRVCHKVWPDEIELWEGLNFSYTILHGGKKEKRLLGSPCDVYIMNYDGLPWLFNIMKKYPKVRKMFDILCLDESTKIKSIRTNRFKILKQILNCFKRRYILTGTPAPNGLIDLFGQIFTLDQGVSLGRYITHFRYKYFYKTGYMGYTWSPLPESEKKIYKAIKPYIIHFDRKLLKLPPLTSVEVKIELSKEVRKQYNTMERKLAIQIGRNIIIAANAAVVSGKCRQICNGGIYSEDRKYTYLHDAKTDACEDIVGELSGKNVLIAYEFNHDLERLRKKFGKNTPYIGGGVSTKQTNWIIDEWNSGKIPILCGQSSAIAHGLNLQMSCHNIIWYGLTWNLEYYLQCVRRLWRQGQKYPVMNYHIIAEDTIDEVMMSVLKLKTKTQNSLLKALKRRLI